MRLSSVAFLKDLFMQLSFLPQIIESKHDYIVDRLFKNELYDLRDDKKIGKNDVVGFCRKCGRPCTKADVMCADVLTFTCRHLGPNANGLISVTQEYECWHTGCEGYHA